MKRRKYKVFHSQKQSYKMSALTSLFFGCLLGLLLGKSQNNFN